MLSNLHIHGTNILRTRTRHGYAVSALIDPYMEGRHIDVRGTGKDKAAAERDLDQRIAQAFAIPG